MKALMKIFNRAFIMAISTILLLTFVSCEDDEKDPAFVGTWVATDVLYFSEDQNSEYKDIMTFTSSTFTNIGQVKNPNTNQWKDYVCLKGKISVTGNLLNVTITEIGMTSFDLLTGMPTGTLVYYKDTQSEFSQIMSEFGMDKTFKSEYSVSGNTLTLKTDHNDDGDYNDEGEITVYSRQK
ncbi:MAG: hypothetical protein N2662_06995 [Bacteroidales bacterium]|nr:hypothetical protein [Bacteroidales bacterium]